MTRKICWGINTGKCKGLPYRKNGLENLSYEKLCYDGMWEPRTYPAQYLRSVGWSQQALPSVANIFPIDKNYFGNI